MWKYPIFVLLEGLNKESDGIQSQIFSADNLPNIEEVYVQIEAVEQRK